MTVVARAAIDRGFAMNLNMNFERRRRTRKTPGSLMPRSLRYLRAGSSDAARCTAIVLATAILAGQAIAAPPTIFYSPNDNGVSGGSPGVIEPGVSQMVHVYLQGGVNATSIGERCNDGDGEEVCGFDLLLEAQGGVSFSNFVPAGDTVRALDPSSLRFNGGDFASGTLGTVKLGDLVVEAQLGGSIDLADGQTADAALGLVDLTPSTLLIVPEPSRHLLLSAGLTALLVLYRRRQGRMASRLDGYLPRRIRID
jgi:hypothetical protein